MIYATVNQGAQSIRLSRLEPKISNLEGELFHTLALSG